MINLFKRTNQSEDQIVKEIHSEIDSLDVKFENEYKKMLEELEIPTENEITRKADKLKKLGFINTSSVKEGNEIQKSIKEAYNKHSEYQKMLKLQNTYKLFYPNDKIVSLEDFSKVLKKYNLFYSSAENYIKDIPEKNVDDMLNAKPLHDNHKINNSYFLTKLEFSFRTYTDKNVIAAGKKVIKYLNQIGYIKINKARWETSISTSSIQNSIDKLMRVDRLYSALNGYLNDRKIIEIKNDSIFIAAPKSHFDLDNVIFDGKQIIPKPKREKSKYEIKDPIAFNLLEGDFVRIITKWGTSDDKSYLDPIVQDEKMN